MRGWAVGYNLIGPVHISFHVGTRGLHGGGVGVLVVITVVTTSATTGGVVSSGTNVVSSVGSNGARLSGQ